MSPKDKKDEIILQQLDVIRTMTENNLGRMGTDFWGNPIRPLKVDSSARDDVPPAPDAGSGGPDIGGSAGPEPPSAASTGNDSTQAPAAEAPPPEKSEDLLAELDGYIGLEAIKKEVRNLINMVTVHKMRRENNLPRTIRPVCDSVSELQ